MENISFDNSKKDSINYMTSKVREKYGLYFAASRRLMLYEPFIVGSFSECMIQTRNKGLDEEYAKQKQRHFRKEINDFLQTESNYQLSYKKNIVKIKEKKKGIFH